MSILTVSHEIGAGGPEIGQKVADQLGLHYVDQELISDAALRYGVLEEKLSSLDESKPSLFERFDAETRRYITVLQTAVFEFAEHDRVVLMGRAGQWLLRGLPHVLRLRVMAPFDRRYLYEVDLRDPSLYDLVVNTDKLSIDAAVEMVAATLERPELVTTPEAQQLVTDRALASRIQVALATNPETRKYRITVEAKNGLVTLEGTAAMDEAVDVARAVRGVREVKTQQVEVPPIPPFVA